MQNSKMSTDILSRIANNFNNLSEQYSYIREAVQFLEKVLQQDHKTTFISFNGGKDATIVLVLTYLALKKQFNNQIISIEEGKLSLKENQTNSGFVMPQGIYFEQPNPFPEMVRFYEEMIAAFNLKMNQLTSKKYAEQLKRFQTKQHFSGIIMGSRNDDPYCEHLDLITESDTHKGYPAFKRINPIIRWNYEQVWTAIKLLEIPYCSLYEQGYSSLGNKDNTVKNPTLCEGSRCLKPYEANPETERVCRVTDRKETGLSS